jgi:hypothetical protein
MYQSLLPILKPLVFEGKSGILTVRHASGEQANIYLLEGIIEQVSTSLLEGPRAIKECMGWVDIHCTFSEDEAGSYTPATDIDIAAILAHLEKISKNIAIIQKRVPAGDTVLQIDPEALNTTDTLGAKDLKIAMLYDGKRCITEVITASGKSELAVLSHTCRLIMAKVVTEAPSKVPMIEEERNFLLHSLEQMLLELVGLAGPLLIQDAFDKIEVQQDTLSQDEVRPLLNAVAEMLDSGEKEELAVWETGYLGDPS